MRSTDLKTLQDYTINLHTHGVSKPVPIGPAAQASTSFAGNSKPPHKRIAFAQANKAPAAKKPKHGKPSAKPKGEGYQGPYKERALAGCRGICTLAGGCTAPPQGAGCRGCISSEKIGDLVDRPGLHLLAGDSPMLQGTPTLGASAACPAAVAMTLDTEEQFLSTAPAITWPFGYGSFTVGVVLNPSVGFVRMFPSSDMSKSLAQEQTLGNLLSGSVAHTHTLLAAPPSELTSALRHYHTCKLSNKDSSVCVLIHKTHSLFATEWLPLLHNMQELPCNLPGHAFFHYLSNRSEEVCKCSALDSSNKPQMVFDRTANGVSATFLVDTGATHCFVDSAFAEEIGVVHSKLYNN